MDLFSTTQEDQNSQGWALLMNTIGYENFSINSYYCEDDRRGTAKTKNLLEKNLLAFFEKRDTDKIKLVSRILNAFFQVPDVYNYWRFSLVLKIFVENYFEEDFGLPECWEKINELGKNKKNCISIFKKLNNLYSAGDISSEQYRNGIQSFVIIFLDSALNEGDAYDDISNLLRLIANNDYLEGESIMDIPEGSGELLLASRRTIEEFTKICIDLPEGINNKNKNYFDSIEWGNVADSIIEAMG